MKIQLWLFKRLRKQNITEGRTENVKTVCPSQTKFAGGIKKESYLTDFLRNINVRTQTIETDRPGQTGNESSLPGSTGFITSSQHFTHLIKVIIKVVKQTGRYKDKCGMEKRCYMSVESGWGTIVSFFKSVKNASNE